MPPNQNQFPAPLQPLPPQPPNQQEQGRYDFFMSPEKPKKPGLLGSGGMSGKNLMIIVGAIVVVLMIVAVIVASLFGGKKEPLALLTVAQTQQELIRVAAEGSKATKSTTLQNFAVTTRVTLTSEQQAVLAQLKKQGVSPKTETLALAKNTKTDQALAAALAANTYDTTFASTMQTELDDYHAKLENASAAALTKAERTMLQKQISSAELLIKQLQSR
ncbi:MAG: hypothetical protein JWP13_852 [Candidatus Saccharibacteria bacterium]|nr:hypothetical protein [Candidatus Saccharibacteria bacterium]